MIAAPGIEIAEVDCSALVRQAGGDDDPVVDMTMYQAGKGKGAEVIDPELQFEALGGQRPRRDHDARIVDEDVDARPGAYRGRRLANLIEIGEIEPHERQVGAGNIVRDARHCRLGARCVAAGKHHRRSARCQDARDFETDAGIGAGDEEAATGLRGYMLCRKSAHRPLPSVRSASAVRPAQSSRGEAASAPIAAAPPDAARCHSPYSSPSQNRESGAPRRP